MLCWKCQKELGSEKISFHSSCPHCFSDLHVCKNCRYFSYGKPNHCEIPNTEPIEDIEKANFCEDFRVQTIPQEKSQQSPEIIAKQLFQDDSEESFKKDFHSLFEDDEENF